MVFSRRHKGIVYVVCAVFLMSLQDALFKFLSSEIVLWQVFVLRGIIATLLLLILFPIAGKSNQVWITAFKPWILLRSVLFAMMFVSFYAAIVRVDLAVVAAGYYTSPIFITLLSAFIIKDPINPLGWFAVLLGFVGVMVILRPFTSEFSFMAMIPVFSGFCYALAAIIVRTKCRNEEPFALVASLNFVLVMTGVLATCTLLFFDLGAATIAIHSFLLGGWIPLQNNAWIIISVLALLMVISAFLLVKAYQDTQPSVIATFDYSYLVFAVFWGMLLFSEFPDIFTVIGMLMIAIAGLLSTDSLSARNEP